MFKTLLLGLAAATLASTSQASVTVSSYSMIDGANLYGAYDDNLYNGAHGPGGQLSGGTGDLTDGVTTALVAAGYGAWRPYVLWDGLSPVITFDLGARFDLSGVRTYFKYFPAAAVYMPGSMGLRFSSDGVNFASSQLRTLLAAERLPGANDSDGVFDVLTAPATARYVELTLNNGPENRWLALGEVVFDGVIASAPAGVPEPGAAALALLALAGLGLTHRRAGSGGRWPAAGAVIRL